MASVFGLASFRGIQTDAKWERSSLKLPQHFRILSSVAPLFKKKLSDGANVRPRTFSLSSGTNAAHAAIVLRPDAALHPCLRVRSVFLRVMCSQTQNVNAPPLTAPRRLQPGRLCPQASCQLSGTEHIFHQEVGLCRQQLSQRVCAEAGSEISSLPEESLSSKRLKMQENLHQL